MQSKTGVYVLEEGANALVTRAWLCEHAEKSIDIQYFIFSTDNIGLIACDYIVRAADRGVKVRILVDDIMVDTDLEDLLVLNAHKNIDIKIYNPGVNLGKNIFQKMGKFATDFRQANLRMHNKTFTVDDRVVITGGRNLADEYFDYDSKHNFRDRDVLLIGKATKEVSKSYDLYWSSDLCVSANLIASDSSDVIDPNSAYNILHEYSCDSTNFSPNIRERINGFKNVIDQIKKDGALIWVEDIQFVADNPGKNDGLNGLEGGGITTSALVTLVNEAKATIDIQTPYLVTTDESRKLFKEIVDRGVRIRILTNSLASTDALEAFSAYQSEREELLATGVEIYEFRPDAEECRSLMRADIHPDSIPIFGLHAKTMVIDTVVAVIGTFNLDPRSSHLNTECLTVLRSRIVAAQVLESIETSFKSENSWPISHEFNPDSINSTSRRVGAWIRKVVPKSIL